MFFLPLWFATSMSKWDVRWLISDLYRSYRFIVFRTQLPGPPASESFGDIAFRVAARSDLDRLDEFEPYGQGSRQRQYVLQDRDWLFLAFHGDRIVMTRRYSPLLPSAARDGHGLMPRVLHLAPRQVWAGTAFCLPEYRNRNIGRYLGLFADQFMASQGYTDIFSAVDSMNAASIRMNLRIGRKPILFVSYTRLLFYERLQVRAQMPPWVKALTPPSAGT